MKEYLMKEYEKAQEMVAYFSDKPGRENRDITMEYTGARQAIGRILTGMHLMTEEELSNFHFSLLVKTA